MKLGNPRFDEARVKAGVARVRNADAFAASVAPIIREVQAAGCKTTRAIAGALNARGVATATVRLVLARLG